MLVCRLRGNVGFAIPYVRMLDVGRVHLSVTTRLVRGSDRCSGVMTGPPGYRPALDVFVSSPWSLFIGGSSPILLAR